jgi:hypothetical protein
MMRRRKFLKLVGLSSLAAGLQIPFGVAFAAAASRTLSAGELSYKWDGSGRVYLSEDGGKTWRQHSDLGPTYSIVRMSADRDGGVHSLVDFRGRTFELLLASDRRLWLTA